MSVTVDSVSYLTGTHQNTGISPAEKQDHWEELRKSRLSGGFYMITSLIEGSFTTSSPRELADFSVKKVK